MANGQATCPRRGHRSGAVASRAIRKRRGRAGRDLSIRTRALLEAGGGGPAGEKGGPATRAPGTNGPNGANGANGPNGADGTSGVDGTNGTNGTNGLNGANGIDGTTESTGTDEVNGADGHGDGVNGTVAPLSAKQGLTALPTAAHRPPWSMRFRQAPMWCWQRRSYLTREQATASIAP